MTTYKKFVLLLCVLLLSNAGFLHMADAAGHTSDGAVDLQMAALEALISAPPDRALPLVNKVLSTDGNARLKERALFILSQIDRPEARARLLQYAGDGDNALQSEAIRMIGIGGNSDTLAELRGIYDKGNSKVRKAVLESLMIAGDKSAVLAIAEVAEGEDFEEAVRMLGVMGAREELRALRGREGTASALIHAYIVSNDYESLLELATKHEDLSVRSDAIKAVGIVGGEKAGPALVDIYKANSDQNIRAAALDGMLISDYDTGVLELYRSSDDPREKKTLLQRLVIMDSDEVWQIIDSALEGGI